MRQSVVTAVTATALFALWYMPSRKLQLFFVPAPTVVVAPSAPISVPAYAVATDGPPGLFPSSRSVPATFMMAANDVAWGGKPVKGTEALMSQKAHGTSATAVQKDLRWGSDGGTADRICNYNRHFAEYAGYFRTTNFYKEAEAEAKSGDLVFYDSNSGKPLFSGPSGRTWENFVQESNVHGWPSFRDEEVNWDTVRVLGDGEVVSVDGTHLGHNLPDGKGNRYCINLVSVAGRPVQQS
jgi:peptide methionine sulfoxide reductase MsrB